MKKFLRVLSLLLAYIVFYGCLQGTVLAAAPILISIPTLTEGVIYEEGASIPLKVSCNSEAKTISHVDFYANNKKLPGAILAGDLSKTLFWNAPLAGEYKVYAKVHYIGGGAYESDKVTVIVKRNHQQSVPSDPMIATPEIPVGQRQVAYDLSAYRIHFNRPLAHFLTENSLAGITMFARDEQIELDYEIGVDYLDLVPKGRQNLSIDKTYIVSIPVYTLCDAYGNKVPATNFTFSTVETIANRATPIPTVCYPASGSLVNTDGVMLAARILFPPEDVDDVVFYDNGKAIAGEVFKGTDGEYILDNVSLISGEHNITVGAFKNGETIFSEAITLTATSGSYEVLGVQNGDRIILNPEVQGYTAFQHKVTIVASDQVSKNLFSTAGNSYLTDDVNFTLEPTAFGVDFVEFAIDGQLVMTDRDAPYEFVFGSEHEGEHVLTATVHKIGGGTEVETVAYTGVLGAVHDSRAVNYDSGVLDASNTPTFNGVVSRGETIKNGALKLCDGNGISAFWLQPDVQTNEMQLGDAKLFYIDYDVKKSAANVHFAFRASRGFRASNISSSNYLQGGFPTGQWVHVTIVADYARGWFSAYLNGVQFKSWHQSYMTDSVSDLVTDSIAVQLHGGELYIDNYAVRTYDVAQADYKITGVKQFETVYANKVGYQLQLGLTDANGNAVADVKQAVFKINGEAFETVTEGPFLCTLPLTCLGPQILSVEITDANDVTQTISVPFAVQFHLGGEASKRLAADRNVPAGIAVVANPGEATSYLLFEAVYTPEGMMKIVTRESVDIAAGEIKTHRAAAPAGGETVKLLAFTKDFKPLY